MPEKDASSSNALPSTAKLEGVILLLTLLIKIGKYLPWIVLAFAGGNMILAVLYFTWWNSITGGILNLVFAFAGFLFFAQLMSRRRMHRRRINLQHSRKEPPRETSITEERNVRAEVDKVQ
jgi:hypothetical protein